jgi:hypothetical protein
VSRFCSASFEGRHVVKALYNNRLCNIVDLSSDATLAEEERQFVVSLGDEALVLDPTDKEVADADNLREGYGLDADAVKQLRSMLRGDLSSPGVG